MRIERRYLDQIMEERRKRDHAAFMVGVAAVEFENAKKRALETISASELTERRLGEQALRAAGLDPRRGEYRINEAGLIGELVDGEWMDPDTRSPIQIQENGIALG